MLKKMPHFDYCEVFIYGGCKRCDKFHLPIIYSAYTGHLRTFTVDLRANSLSFTIYTLFRV